MSRHWEFLRGPADVWAASVGGAQAVGCALPVVTRHPILSRPAGTLPANWGSKDAFQTLEAL